MTTEEMLDALELGIRSLQERNAELAKALAEETPRADVHWTFPAQKVDPARPDMLRNEIGKTGLTEDTVAGMFGVSTQSLRDWLRGKCAIPSWVVPSVRFLERVNSSARRNGAGSGIRGNAHPFSRIEDL